MNVTPIGTGAEPYVLVVEDDLDLARVMAASLNARGIRTIHATTGEEAIEILRRDTPALVILDLVLPELDGFGVVDRMRADAELANVGLIVFSAQEVSASDQQRLRLGPTDFLTKSRVTLDELAERVLTLLHMATLEDVHEGAA
jgi:DNA-binding response OmpR family regulator